MTTDCSNIIHLHVSLSLVLFGDIIVKCILKIHDPHDCGSLQSINIFIDKIKSMTNFFPKVMDILNQYTCPMSDKNTLIM